jgi:predicted NUDIX family NTP pyrophosphohydrolase
VTTSAGLVLFRKRDGTLQVLLGHMGGPYWTHKDEGAWSIPKGELSEGEDALPGALREYTEELGHPPPDGPVIELGEIRQRAGKRLVAFAVEGDFDPAQLKPGTFELEWPPHSGRRQAFPEIDRVAWIDLATAKRKIVQGQARLLDRLTGRHPSGDGSSEKFLAQRGHHPARHRRIGPP